MAETYDPWNPEHRKRMGQGSGYNGSGYGPIGGNDVKVGDEWMMGRDPSIYSAEQGAMNFDPGKFARDQMAGSMHAGTMAAREGTSSIRGQYSNVGTGSSAYGGKAQQRQSGLRSGIAQGLAKQGAKVSSEANEVRDKMMQDVAKAKAGIASDDLNMQIRLRGIKDDVSNYESQLMSQNMGYLGQALGMKLGEGGNKGGGGHIQKGPESGVGANYSYEYDKGTTKQMNQFGGTDFNNGSSYDFNQ